jgi:hypothetical protein
VRTTRPTVLKRSRARDARVSGFVVDGRALPNFASYHAASTAAAAALGSFVASGPSVNAVADFVDVSAPEPLGRSRALNWSSIESRKASTWPSSYPRPRRGGEPSRVSCVLPKLGRTMKLWRAGMTRS